MDVLKHASQIQKLCKKQQQLEQRQQQTFVIKKMKNKTIPGFCVSVLCNLNTKHKLGTIAN